MTDDELSAFFDRVSVCSYADFEDKGELSEYLDKIRSIDLPPGFSNRIIDIDDGNLTDFEIHFGETGPDPPSESENHVLVNYDNEDTDQLHIHSYMNQSTLDDGLDIFNEISEIVGELDIHILSAQGYAMLQFEELDLPIAEDSQRKPNGVRYSLNDRSYLVQAAPEEMIPEDEEYLIYFRMNQDDISIDTEMGGDLVSERLDELEEYLLSLRKQ